MEQQPKYVRNITLDEYQELLKYKEAFNHIGVNKNFFVIKEIRRFEWDQEEYLYFEKGDDELQELLSNYKSKYQMLERDYEMLKHQLEDQKQTIEYLNEKLKKKKRWF